MNKILSFILIGFILPCTLYAQKIKLSKKEATVNIVDLPYAHLEDVKTYSTVITNNSKELWSIGLNKTDLERQYLKLNGFQRVAKGGDILVELTIGKFQITKEEEKEKSIGSGSDKKHHFYRFDYKLPITLQVIKDGNVITDFKETSIQSLSFDSPNYKDWEDARSNRTRYKYN